MHYTLTKLLKGDAKVVKHYVAALEKWREILDSSDGTTVDLLSKRLTNEQFWFENQCGGRFDGQEVMAWVGIAHLWNDQIGFDASKERVLLVFDSLMASFCSLEVKWHAERAADSYHLDDLRSEDADE